MNVDLASDLCDSKIVSINLLSIDQSEKIREILQMDDTFDMIITLTEVNKK